MGHRVGVIKHKENPFMTEHTVSTRRKRITVGGRGRAIIDTETGEVEDTAEIVMVRDVDSEQFVKLFTQNIRVFFDLTPGTMKLVQVLLSQVQKHPNTDRVMLSIAIAQDYFAETQGPTLSKASFHRAVKEMLEKQFIAETMLSGLFFINPNLFFNGDRIRFVNEIKRRKANEEHAELVGKIQAGELGRSSTTLSIENGVTKS